MSMVRLILATLSLMVAAGCDPKPPEAPKRPAAGPAAPLTKADALLLRFHFTGVDSLASQTNAPALREVAELPATKALLAQSARKLARALAKGEEQPTNSSMATVLLDLFKGESFVEAHGTTNEITSWIVAVKLPAGRSEVWQAELRRAFGPSGAGGQTALQLDGFAGWRAGKLFFIEKDSWVISGVSNDDQLLQAQIQRLKSARPPGADDAWLEAEIDFAHLGKWLPPGNPFSMPKLDVAFGNKSGNVRSTGRLLPTQPVFVKLEPWLIPANTIQDPIISFTAMQGISGALGQHEAIRRLQLPLVPNQLFVWAQSDWPYQTFGAWPMKDSTNQVKQLAPKLEAQFNPAIARQGLGQIRQPTNRVSVAWIGLPIIVPYITPAPEPGDDFLVAGIFPMAPERKPVPSELIAQFNMRTNLVYYDWEITEARLNQWRQLLSLLMVVLSPEPPALMVDVAGQKWLEAIAPKLGNAITEISVKSPQELSLVRRSHIGLTGIELVLLARWLDADHFPAFSAPARTNAAPGLPTVPTVPKGR
jgi:hypothetical protein